MGVLGLGFQSQHWLFLGASKYSLAPASEYLRPQCLKAFSNEALLKPPSGLFFPTFKKGRRRLLFKSGLGRVLGS